MGCVNSSVCKLCRRENMKLFLKGERCYTDKCAFERRAYPPGQHWQARLKFSEFALQLREKQKAKRYYGMSEKQFRKYVEVADRSKDVTGTALLKLLEQRLDNVVYTLGYASSRKEARQFVSHGHVLVNGKKVTVASYLLKKGDQVEIRESSRTLPKIQAVLAGTSKRTVPSWLDAQPEQFKGLVKELPSREDVTLPVEENMIVEFYSR